MLEIEKTISSLDLFEQYFQCDLNKCKGQCCVEGDSGAPLEENEIKKLQKAYPKIKKYLPEKNRKLISLVGVYEIDKDNDIVTPCIDDKDCVFLIYKKDIAICAIEKAFFNKEIKFQKPISCHLFPLRITKYKDFDAINYEKRKICKSARKTGKKNNILLYQYLKTPLIKKYGEEWYNKIEIAGREIRVKNSEIRDKR